MIGVRLTAEFATRLGLKSTTVKTEDTAFLRREAVGREAAGPLPSDHVDPSTRGAGLELGLWDVDPTCLTILTVVLGIPSPHDPQPL